MTRLSYYLYRSWETMIVVVVLSVQLQSLYFAGSRKTSLDILGKVKRPVLVQLHLKKTRLDF